MCITFFLFYSFLYVMSNGKIEANTFFCCCCVYTFFNYIFGFSRHIIRTSKCFLYVVTVLVLLLLIHNIKYTYLVLLLVVVTVWTTNILTKLIEQAKFRNFLVFTKLLHKICSIFRCCCYVSLQRLKFSVLLYVSFLSK